ncbi:MAG: DNA adenine methylase [Planctomycetales bacterium]
MTGSRRPPQPIPYQGSKRLIAPAIMEHFPAAFSRFVEPFAGSAATSLALATTDQDDSRDEHPSDDSRDDENRFWINDGNDPLIRLWKEIIDSPEVLADEYSRLWNDQLGREREYFDFVRDRFNAEHAPADLLYLLARCVKAAVRYNARGEFNNAPDNRRKGARPPTVRRRVLQASALLRGRTRLTSWDYQRVLAEAGASDLVYLDPPYQGVGGRDTRYLPKVDHDEFCDELAKLNRRGVMFAVSHDGRTGTKTYGQLLPSSLNLKRLELRAGRSAQATLLGRDDVTFESLYLSPALIETKAREASDR